MQAHSLVFGDIDGVKSLGGWESNARPDGAYDTLDGVLHVLSAGAGNDLLAFAKRFERRLSRPLALPGPLSFLSSCAGNPRGGVRAAIQGATAAP